MKDVLDIPRTAMEVYETLPEGTACEVIDNTLYMSPSPTRDHQRLLGKLFNSIQTFAEKHSLGEAFFAPYDVYLDDKTSVVQPDIVFIKNERVYIAEQRAIIGSPDFVIELLSSNKIHDQQRKLTLYERNAIPEYHIIDPETKEVWSYGLVDGTYKLTESEQGKLTIKQLDLSIAF